MIEGKQAARVTTSKAQELDLDEARGRDKGKGTKATSGRGCAPWGNIKGEKEKEGRKYSACRIVWVQLLARAYIYIISYILYIYIYIIYISII